MVDLSATAKLSIASENLRLLSCKYSAWAARRTTRHSYQKICPTKPYSFPPQRRNLATNRGITLRHLCLYAFQSSRHYLPMSLSSSTWKTERSVHTRFSYRNFLVSKLSPAAKWILTNLGRVSPDLDLGHPSSQRFLTPRAARRDLRRLHGWIIVPGKSRASSYRVPIRQYFG